jgi:hypothetical protein
MRGATKEVIVSKIEQLAVLRALIRKLWDRACRHDGIENPSTPFVEFSQSNPYASQMNWARLRSITLRNEVARAAVRIPA